MRHHNKPIRQAAEQATMRLFGQLPEDRLSMRIFGLLFESGPTSGTVPSGHQPAHPDLFDQMKSSRHGA
jgi:hypothetical protein